MIYRNKWMIKLSEHALRQAFSAWITPDMIVATIKTGKMKWFGKNFVDFINEYKIGRIVCRGCVKENNIILIITVGRSL